MSWISHKIHHLGGEIRAASDKSCSHRAIILGGLANGCTQISQLLEADDVLRTVDSVSALGAKVEQLGVGRWTVHGVGRAGIVSPVKTLDFGNSGTGSRLMMGAIAGYPVWAQLDGDYSLRRRPMSRILDPLEQMGAHIRAEIPGRLPLTLNGSDHLKSINFTPPHASAQVKSAILLAGLRADGITEIIEPKHTRDHTENMLRLFGVTLESQIRGEGCHIRLEGRQDLYAQSIQIPGDPSSAAFLAAATLISPNSKILIKNVLDNPSRNGFWRIIEQMGGDIRRQDAGHACGELLIDLEIIFSTLTGLTIDPAIVPSMIDEFPILAVLAACAKGDTIITGAQELRVKESDRIDAVLDMLKANGVEAEGFADGFRVVGCDGPPPGGGKVNTRGDHRIAMSALVMGCVADKPIQIDDGKMIATSYPDFVNHMNQLGADIRKV